MNGFRKLDHLNSASLTLKHLLNNSTVHQSPQSAIAEFVDNSYDANAKNCSIEVYDTPNNERIEILDDGDGMTRSEALNIVKFGFSNKVDNAIGRYGMGLKSGGLYIGRDILLLTKKDDEETAVFISHSFLRAENTDEKVYIPSPSWKYGEAHVPTIEDAERFDDECGIINQYMSVEGYESFEQLFDKIPGEHGTLIIISKLQRDPRGELEINITGDKWDIQDIGDNLPPHKLSLRKYLEILYLNPKMAITLRGKDVYPRNVVDNWMARYTVEYNGDMSTESLNKTIHEIQAQKAQLERQKTLLLSENAEYYNEENRHDEGSERKRMARTQLVKYNADIRICETEIAVAKAEKGKSMKAVIGLHVENREECGIHFYVNNRLIIFGHKSKFWNKNEEAIGISVYMDLKFCRFRPTSNKQGFECLKDFNAIVKKCDQTVQIYHDHLKNIWIPRHMKSEWPLQKGKHDFKSFWKTYGYASLDKSCKQTYLEGAPQMNRQAVIEKECGIWKLCLKCRMWKRIRNQSEVFGPISDDMFQCRNVKRVCGNEPDGEATRSDLPLKVKEPADVKSSASASMLSARQAPTSSSNRWMMPSTRANIPTTSSLPSFRRKPEPSPKQADDFSGIEDDDVLPFSGSGPRRSPCKEHKPSIFDIDDDIDDEEVPPPRRRARIAASDSDCSSEEPVRKIAASSKPSRPAASQNRRSTGAAAKPDYERMYNALAKDVGQLLEMMPESATSSRRVKNQVELVKKRIDRRFSEKWSDHNMPICHMKF
ncbi:hypothetical protein L5515_005048 [Caenorhabditis briggsae]|uniref:Uncharacterized protein n=1 Tax=Caenorhabditis briggsae TaxID=6238 RepID=A0AAE9EQJ8_CAEBR|nr:hypothetical protein L5515_005048 [Caenorhabditis briggsae]